MLWADVALKVDGADVVDLRPAGLPVDRALVELVVPARRRVDCVDVDHRHLLVQNLNRGVMLQVQNIKSTVSV